MMAGVKVLRGVGWALLVPIAFLLAPLLFMGSLWLFAWGVSDGPSATQGVFLLAGFALYTYLAIRITDAIRSR